MKQLNIFILFFLFALMVGCEDEKTDNSTSDTINVILKNTDTYLHDFGLMGIEDGATIKIEAQHAASSSMSRNNMNRLIYNYQPKGNFTGNDKVQIEQCLSPGDASCYATTVTTINFTITD
ncbi:MAG TPA: hypothetical protein PLJ60_03910 [Chryseolinea sp.]|nr:hypothetical protein [Chryseolinea sp.]HPM29461.1 hypothetical protein [Chryseolinea sp.]